MLLTVVPTGFSAGATDLTHLITDTIAEPMDLDPAWSYDTGSAELLMNVYEPLLWFNRTSMSTYIPMIASEWTNDIISETDAATGIVWKNRWYFKLNASARFQDDGVAPHPPASPGEGDFVTTQDIEYTFERFLVTDAATGPSWMLWDPLFAAGWAGDLNDTLTDLGWPLNATTGWNTKMDIAIDHAVEENGTWVWFNLVMPYEPILQILAQQWGSIMSKEWCTSHAEEFPGFTGDTEKDDEWANYHDPDESYVLKLPTAGPGPHTDAACGTGPYILDYWNKGPGGAWSVVKDPEYWRSWTNFDGLHPNHVDRYSSNYIVEWPTRRLRFLGGLSDFTAVPRMFRDEVLNQSVVDTVFPLPNLACDAAFFTFLVKDTSPYIGTVQTNGTFNVAGMPPNMFNDTKVRVGFSHLINWTAYLDAAFLNEAVSPPTPIVPGLSYYDPSIGLEENPGTHTIKELGITGEPAGQKAYDLVLASKYLKDAWDGDMWTEGFTFKAVYNEGNLPRQVIAEMLRDSLD